MTKHLFLLLFVLSLSACSPKSPTSGNVLTTMPPANFELIDYGGFYTLTAELKDYREERRIDLRTFADMLQQEGVLLLDTRSARAFESVHIKGATHLNFSDFTEEKLAKVIPNKDTPVLIYCNNNFRAAGPELAAKSSPLALNIPTFINLYGYGYENIYELKGAFTPSEISEYLEMEMTEAYRLFFNGYQARTR